jgi:uncharacterized protein YegP (UPF0339 family)
MSSKFEIYLSKNNEFYFRLKAGNGEIILASEGYTTKSNCQGGIKSVQTNAGDDKHYDKKAASNGKFFFNLKAVNGQIIGSSQQYASEQSRDAGIESVKKNAAQASIVDLTSDKK